MRTLDVPLTLDTRSDDGSWPLEAIIAAARVRPDLRTGKSFGVWRRARFDLRLRYDRPPEPPLREDDAEWARGLVGRSG